MLWWRLASVLRMLIRSHVGLEGTSLATKYIADIAGQAVPLRHC